MVDRARATETLLRVGALLIFDLLILVAAHDAVDLARTAATFDKIPILLAELLPRGTFPRGQVVLAIVLGLAIFGSYRGAGRWHRPQPIFAGSTLGLSLVFWSRMWEGLHLAAIAGFALLLVAVGASLVAGRFLVKFAIGRVGPAPLAVSRALVLGASNRAEQIKQFGLAHSESRLTIIGHVTTDRAYDVLSLGVLSDLVWLIERHDIDTIIIDAQLEDDALVDVLEVADRFGCTTVVGYPSFPLGGFVPHVQYRQNVPYVCILRPGLRWAQLMSKRVLDVVGAATLMILLSPLFALVAIAVKLSSPGPVFFRSLRVGYGGKPFEMYKFRTMVQNAEEMKSTLSDESVYRDPRLFKVVNDPRVTRLGRFLRRSSLDELPQFWNVLRGEMSMVGPRPPLATEVALYEENNYSRFDMKPGITGPWQVSGRSSITSFDEIVALETAYLTDWTLGRDLMILLRTVPAVLSMHGAA